MRIREQLFVLGGLIVIDMSVEFLSSPPVSQYLRELQVTKIGIYTENLSHARKICYVAIFILLIITDDVAGTKCLHFKNPHKVTFLPHVLVSISLPGPWPDAVIFSFTVKNFSLQSY